MELLDSGHIHWLCVVPASTIAAANKTVKKVIAVDAGKEEKGTACSSHGQCRAYEHFTPKKKAHVGKRTLEHGVTATVHFYSKSFPGHPLKESCTTISLPAFLFLTNSTSYSIGEE